MNEENSSEGKNNMGDFFCYKLSPSEEEILANTVREYTYIYDKKIYASKETIDKAWNDIAEKLDFIEDGTKARLLFERLRKRYNRKKNNMKKAKRISHDQYHYAAKAFANYEFLNWLDDYIFERERRSTHTANTEIGDKRKFDAGIYQYSDQEQYNSDVEGGNIVILSKHHSSVLPSFNQGINDKEFRPTFNKTENESNFRPTFDKSINNKVIINEKNSHQIQSQQEQFEREVTSSNLGQEKHTEVKEATKIEVTKTSREHPVDVYVRSLADDLKTLKERDLIMAKHEISNIVFKYQMSYYEQTE